MHKDSAELVEDVHNILKKYDFKPESIFLSSNCQDLGWAGSIAQWQTHVVLQAIYIYLQQSTISAHFLILGPKEPEDLAVLEQELALPVSQFKDKEHRENHSCALLGH